MATSDSEDFESADEDIEIRSDHTALCSAEKEKESDAHSRNEDGDNKREKALVHLMNEIGSGKLQEYAPNCIKDPEVFDSCNEADKLDSAHLGAGSDVNISYEGPIKDKTKDNKKREHVKRHQKPREPKSSRSVKKLGTKISSSVLYTSSESEREKVKQDLLSSEKCEETSNRAVADTHDEKEGKSIQSPSHRMENLEQELGKLSVEGREHDIASVLENLSQSASEKETEADGNWGGWGGWGVTSLLSTATESVSTLTTHVSQGLSTVLETGIGAPDPEELAWLEKKEELKQHKEKKQNETNEFSELQHQEEQKAEAESTGLFGFGHLMSGVSSITRLVESTGSRVLTGGLDTLETIGKKTMEVLQEGDPGLKKKRALFTNRTVLSQVLREAKEKAERETKEVEDNKAARKAHFETLFDDYQGLVHLEALEMLSKQCDIKLQSLLLTSSGTALSQLQQSLQEVKDLCQLPDDEDTEEEEGDAVDWRGKLDAATEGLGVPVATDKLNRTWDMAQGWLGDCRASQKSSDSDKVVNARDIHQKAIATLAQFTAESVEQFHKAAELLLIKDGRSPTEEAQTLLQVTSILSSQVSAVATAFSECLNAATENSSDPDAVNTLITSVFLEAANSSSYIQEAFQLLVPVLEVALIK